MKPFAALQLGLSAILATIFGLAACSSDEVGSASSDATSCDGAYLDDGGRCRLPNGQFAKGACCVVDAAALETACEAYCAVVERCDYGAEPDCVADCVGRGTECFPSRLAEFASCPEYYAECDDGEDFGQCADQSGCLAEIVTPPDPPDPKLPYESACESYCGQMESCDENFGDDYYCASSCLADCSLAELAALEECNAEKGDGCTGQATYVDCLRASVGCIAPPVPPIHEGEGPWGEACADYCDIVWQCDYGYSESCMADCTAHETGCTDEDRAALAECAEWYAVCDDGEDFGQCVDAIGCFAEG